MKCIKCRREIPEESIYCNFCGKKQIAAKPKYHKRANGMGTISRDKRYRNQYIAHAPSAKSGAGRVYIGSFQTMREAQEAIDKYVKEGRPELYNASLADIYSKWSAVHFMRVSDSAVSLYTSMWKRFASIQGIKMRDIRTVHLQDVVNSGTSRSACETLKAMSVMLCRFAMENDIINKNYAEFIKLPKFEKKEKKIFSKEDILKLWENSDDKTVQGILFMIYTGFRIGEIVKLRVSDVHLAEGYVTGGEKTEAGRNRIVPLPPNIPELTEFVKNWVDNAVNGRLFPETVSQFREDFYSALIKCGIDNGKKINGRFVDEHYTPHSTRHTFASLSAAAGIQPENLQKIIGHSNYATTANVYIHQDIELLRNEMGKISK